MPDGRFSFFFACLSARFSFSDLPAFLLFDFFGDLSATGAPQSLGITGRGYDDYGLRRTMHNLVGDRTE